MDACNIHSSCNKKWLASFWLFSTNSRPVQDLWKKLVFLGFFFHQIHLDGQQFSLNQTNLRQNLHCPISHKPQNTQTKHQIFTQTFGIAVLIFAQNFSIVTEVLQKKKRKDVKCFQRKIIYSGHMELLSVCFCNW